MKILSVIILVSVTLNSFGQFTNLDDKISRLTTIIISQSGQLGEQGSGFFFQELSSKSTIINGQEKFKIENLWLITNRHVAIMKGKNQQEYLPEKLTFNLRRKIKDTVQWVPIQLSQTELKKRLRFHTDSTVDVVAINIFDLVVAKMKVDSSILPWEAVSEKDLPELKKIDIEVTQDVVTTGYPFGFFDTTNIFPIVKYGIIASRWKSKFNGNPYFLIDSKLFPGSSGSIVLSKPSNFIEYNGSSYGNREKEYAFLGIYSGEPYRISPETFDLGDMIVVKKQRYDVGVVWYSYLIIEIIKKGLRVM